MRSGQEKFLKNEAWKLPTSKENEEHKITHKHQIKEAEQTQREKNPNKSTARHTIAVTKLNTKKKTAARKTKINLCEKRHSKELSLSAESVRSRACCIFFSLSKIVNSEPNFWWKYLLKVKRKVRHSQKQREKMKRVIRKPPMTEWLWKFSDEKKKKW